MTDQDREWFEGWMATRVRDASLAKNEKGDYLNDCVAWAWEGWKAAKRPPVPIGDETDGINDYRESP